MGCNATVQDPESSLIGIFQYFQRADCSVDAYSHHLLTGLKDEETLKKTPEKQGKKKVVEEVPMSLSES